MLLPAPFILPKQWHSSPKGAMVQGFAESLHIPGWRSRGGGLGNYPPHTNLSQQEAMTHPNPKSCILVGGGSASFQLSTPVRGMTRQGRTQAPSSSNGSPTTGPCLCHSPGLHHRAAEVSPPPWSSATDRALHTRQERTEAKLEAAAVAGKEQAPRMVGCWLSSTGPGALQQSGQAACPRSSGPATRWV